MPSPDGSRIITDDIETHRLFIYDVRDLSKPLETLPPNPDPAVKNLLATDWSPDGQRILYASPATVRGGVWMDSTADRTHRRLADGGSGAWLRDGRRLLYSDAGRLKIFDTGSNSSREVLAIPGESLAGERLAADDSQLFFLRSTSDGDIWVVRFGDDDDKRRTR